jgi:tRNA wybutosine-synthesizing protein 1
MVAQRVRATNSPVSEVAKGMPVTGKILILYGTTTGTAKAFALKLQGKLVAAGRETEVSNMANYDQEKLVKENIVLYICSTWEGGEVPVSCGPFLVDLKDYANDFRVSKDLLEKVHFAAFGLGGELYGSNFGKSAIEIDEMMRKLGANGLADVVLGDDASNLEEKFGRWSSQMLSLLTGSTEMAASDGEPLSKRQQKKALRAQEVGQKKLLEGKSKGDGVQPKKFVKPVVTKPVVVPNAVTASTGCCKAEAGNKSASQGDCGCNAPQPAVNPNTLGLEAGCCSDDDAEEEEDLINNAYVTMDQEDDGTTSYESPDDAAEDLHHKEMEGLLDLEDMGAAVNNTAKASKQHRQAVKDALRDSSETAPAVERREMVTKLQRKALTKEGYKIIGTHSAVKICRWTKNQLRGRGGCYKHSFYGITSYQCMEATPSLACANKCVFCWRHHKNPVGTEWRWKEDSPEMIVSEAVRLHQVWHVSTISPACFFVYLLQLPGAYMNVAATA